MAAVYLGYHFDGSLVRLAEATAVHACVGQSTSFADVAVRSLGSGAFAAGDGNGKFTIADDGAGRAVTMTAQAAITMSGAGVVDHIAYTDAANNRYWVAPLTAAVTVANGVDLSISSHKVTQTGS